MKKLFLILISELFLFSFLQAQTVSQSTESCYFGSGSAVLNGEAKLILDNIIQKTLDAGDYHIGISANTDADGSDTYNRKLSEKRANVILNYLLEHNIFVEKTHSNAFGESQPIAPNDHENGKAKNRRVDIDLTLTTYTSFDEIINEELAKAKQQFVINPFVPNTIDLDQGSTLEIPSDAFCFADGTVPQKGVVISCIEAYHYMDMLRFGLTTQSDAQMLETGGMLNIKANSEGKPLQLKAGKSITVMLPPTKVFKQDMELFYGVAENKQVNWTAAKQRTRRIQKTPKLNFYDIDRSVLDKVQITLPPKPQVPTFGPLPSKVVAPKMPTQPRKPIEADYATAPENLASLSRNDKKKWAKEAKKIAFQKTQYQQLLENYEKRMAQYSKDKHYYETIAYPKYLKDKAAFDAEILRRFEVVQSYITTASDYEAIKLVLICKSQYQKIKISDKTSMNIINPYITFGAQGSSLGNDVLDKAFGIYMDSVRTKITSFYKSIANNAHKSDEALNYVDLVTTKFEKVAMESNLTMALAAMNAQRQQLQQVLLEKRIANNQADVNEVTRYVFNIQKLDWINCDRFMNIPDNQKTIVKVKENSEDDVRCFLVFKDIKSIMPFAYTDNMYVTRTVPKQSDVTIIAIKIKAGKPHFARTDTQIGVSNIYEMEFKPCTARVLIQNIASVN